MQYPNDPTAVTSAHSVYREATVHHRPLFTARTSWGAIFAGLAVALAVQILLTLAGVGIGLSTVDAVDERNPVSGLGTGAVVWGVLSLLVTLFAGGWVAGRLSGTRYDRDGALHGLVVFGLVVIASFYLLTSAVGSVVSGAASVVGKGLSVAGAGAAMAAPELKDKVQSELHQNGINLDNLKAEAELLLRQTGKPALQPTALEQQVDAAQNKVENAANAAAANPQASEATGQNLIDSLFAQGKAVGGQVDREAAINVVMARSNKSREEATVIVDRWINTYEQAKVAYEQKKAELEAAARKQADETAAALSKASLMGFIGLLLGAVAALFGGLLGARRAAVTLVTVPEVRPTV